MTVTLEVEGSLGTLSLYIYSAVTFFCVTFNNPVIF